MGNANALELRIMRGFNVDHRLKERDFIDLKDMQVNALRVSFAVMSMFMDDGSLNQEAVEKVQEYLHYSKGKNIGLIIDFHTFPGNVKKFSGTPSDKIWFDEALRRRLIASYHEFASIFKDENCIIGYDIANEVAPPSEKINVYHEFFEKIIEAINSVDEKKMIIVQPPITLNKNGIPLSQVESWHEIDKFFGKNTIKSIHYYYPGQYTHQGILGFKSPMSLPFPLNSNFGLNQYLSTTVRNIIPAHEKIIIGEFTVSNAAPNDSLHYITGVIDFFEERGWHWFFHAFRYSPIWDPEVVNYGEERIVEKNSPKMQILKRYFKKNEPIQCN